MFDYYVNRETKTVALHTVKSYALQEKFSISGAVFIKNNVNCIKSNIKSPLEIDEGAYAAVNINGEHYDGYLKELEKSEDGEAVACVSIVSDEKIDGQATAEVYGGIDNNVIIIPEQCIFRDEKNCTSVMIANRGYCVKRNVTVGEIRTAKGIEIRDGLFSDEKIVLEPKNVKTGDKYN